ncbi:MAG: enoyl-ACP reductase FabI, partial [Steroidobacteraceae bacterium]
MGFLTGKKALIVGLATDRSIAWGISQALRREGAELAFTYQNDRIKDRVVEHAGELGSTLVMPMDVGIDAEIDAAFSRLGSEWGALDVIVHSVAFAPREALTGGFVETTTREAFATAHDVSSYSLTALARAGLPLMTGRAGALLT